MLGRVAALLAGLGILAVAALSSLGLPLLAPLSMWLAHRIQRARGRVLSRWGSWVSAVGATVLALLLVGAVGASRLPPGTWRKVWHAADSATVAARQEPPPEWLSRLAPRTKRYDASNTRLPSTIATAVTIWGLALGVGLFGIAVGSVGWLGAMLLVFYASGRWWGSPVAIDVDEGERQPPPVIGTRRTD